VNGWAARISFYELAFRMQSNAPERSISRRRGAERHQAHVWPGPKGTTAEFREPAWPAGASYWSSAAWRVFVQLYSGGRPDYHAVGRTQRQLVFNTEKMCGHTGPSQIAALLEDLKPARGCWIQPLVVCGAVNSAGCLCHKSGNGRDHNPHGFYHVVLPGGGREDKGGGRGAWLGDTRRVRACAGVGDRLSHAARLSLRRFCNLLGPRSKSALVSAHKRTR